MGIICDEPPVPMRSPKLNYNHTPSPRYPLLRNTVATPRLVVVGFTKANFI